MLCTGLCAACSLFIHHPPSNSTGSAEVTRPRTGRKNIDNNDDGTDGGCHRSTESCVNEPVVPQRGSPVVWFIVRCSRWSRVETQLLCHYFLCVVLGLGLWVSCDGAISISILRLTRPDQTRPKLRGWWTSRAGPPIITGPARTADARCWLSLMGTKKPDRSSRITAYLSI